MRRRLVTRLAVVLGIGSTAPGALGQEPLLWESSAPGGSVFGASVAGAGDLNADGRADVIVGEMVPGPVLAGVGKILSGADGSVLLVLSGGGWIVAAAGDLDGDGVPDYLTGIHFASCYFSPPCVPGSVTAFSGASGSALYAISPGSINFGWSLAAGGDVNGDGVPDFAVGELGLFAHVYSGATGTLIRSLSVDHPTDIFGTSVAGIGDADLDDVSDFVVGAAPGAIFEYLVPTHYLGRGHTYVFSGATGDVVRTFQGGRVVAGAGRVDGDLVDDVIVGMPQVNSSRGRVRLLSGASGLPIRVLKGNLRGGSFGSGVAGVGDVTGDGASDFVVRSTVPTPGPAAWRATVFSGATGNVLLALTGNPGDGGANLAGAGDVNADGIPDLVVGVPGIDLVRVYSLANLFDLAGAKGRADLLRTPGEPDPDANGKVELRVRQGDQRFQVEARQLEGAATDPYAAFVEYAPGSGAFLALGPLTASSMGRWSLLLSATGTAPAGLGVNHLGSLEGRILEIRNSSGTVFLHASLPDLTPGPDGVASAALSLPPSPPTPGAAGLVERQSRPKKGSQRFAVSTSGLAAGLLFSIHIEDAAGSGNFVAAGDLTQGRFIADTRKGTPLPLGVLSVTDLTGRAIEIREGGTLYLQGVIP